MAGKADFTEPEWQTMQKGVTGSGMLVSVADRGFFDSFKEVGALTKHLSEPRKKSESPLIQELAEVRGTGFGLTASPQEVESGTTEALRSAVGTLQAKAPDEVQAYRDFVLAVAQSVAAAADEVGATETEGSKRSRRHSRRPDPAESTGTAGEKRSGAPGRVFGLLSRFWAILAPPVT